MASVIGHDIGRPRPSLSIDRRASWSPFPSPGSPFLPPPRLGAHEFALRPTPSSPLMHSPVTKMREDVDIDDDVRGDGADDGGHTPTTQPSQLTQPTLLLSLASPMTPTPTSTSSTLGSPSNVPQIAIPSPPASPALSLSASTRDSLRSSRPAPRSPAVSRRTSAALSRRSSNAKLRRSSSRLPQAEMEASTSATPTTPTPTPQPQPQPKRRSVLVKIRDFAFPAADGRHVGRGADVPRANRIRRHLSTSSSSSAEDALVEPPEDAHSSWGSFRWNTLSTRFSWSGGDGAPPGDAPSHTDFERNFVAESPMDDEPQYDDDGEYEEEEEDGAQYRSDDGPLVAGLYRALFAFEPEGTAEMALEEEQVVRVIGRGGGVGWAVVEKEDGGQALVPESYLQLVAPDGDEDV